MSERETRIGRQKAQEGGFQLREEYHWAETNLDSRFETLKFLQQMKEEGMKRATVTNPQGERVTIPLDSMIEVIETLIQNQIGKLPPKE